MERASPSAPHKPRRLPSIPPDPSPTKRQIEAELRRNTFAKSVAVEMQRHIAEFFCHAKMKFQFPDRFWHPFSPSGYEAYLISDTWRRISRKIKAEAGHKCACCPNKATQVHHRCYRPRVLSGKDTSLLIALCATCHKAVDFDEHGRVREAHAKERMLAEMFDRESERLAVISAIVKLASSLTTSLIALRRTLRASPQRAHISTAGSLLNWRRAALGPDQSGQN